MKKKEIFKFLFLFCFVCFLFCICIISTIFIYYSANLPRHTKLEDYQPPITSRFYSNDGKLLKEYANEKRIFVSIDNIPNLVKNAFISAEDKNFYKHKGLDPQALLSAMIYNIYAYLKGLQFRGGSTITQQIVKNMLLTNERTIERKIKEAILSFRITRDFEKDKVLELYLNHIFLGNNSYGVASAALTYFNKSLDELSPEEAAVLASLPKAPGKLNPYLNYSSCLARRNWVLERMYHDGYLSIEKFNKSINTKIILNKRQEDEYFNAGAFAEEVRKKMLKTFDEESLMKDGLVVSTTINPNMQEILDKNFKSGLESYDKRYGYRGALANIYINNEKNFNENWPIKLKEFKITEYYRNNWKRAVILKMDDKNKIIKIGLLNNKNSLINEFDIVKSINGIEVKESYISLDNLKWVIEPSLLNQKTIIENDEETKVEYKVNKITDTNLFLGDIIFVEETNKNGYLLKQTPLVNGGAVVLDVHTGKVLAMVGGYVDSEVNFNRVTQAKRQPGSSIKPFVYLSAFENGYEPSDTIMDEEIVLSQGLGIPSYKPRNFNKDTYYGLVTLRKALQSSYNVSTVRLASEIGLDKVTETIKRFGINKKPKRVYSVALGSLESHLIDMTKAYAILVNGGKHIDIETVEKVQDKYGKTVFKRDIRLCKKCLVSNTNIEEVEVPFTEDLRESITDPASAYQVVSILEGVVKYGTAWRVKSIGKNIGGKTGTSNDFRDAWFIGFSPDIVLGIYVGFDDNRSLGENETGAKTATPIFVNTMKEILKDNESTPFRVPNNIQFKKIDMTTGQAPTLISIDKNIIFEALKINNDKIKNNNKTIQEKKDIEINSEETKELNDYEDLTNLVF